MIGDTGRLKGGATLKVTGLYTRAKQQFKITHTSKLLSGCEGGRRRGGKGSNLDDWSKYGGGGALWGCM